MFSELPRTRDILKYSARKAAVRMNGKVLRMRSWSLAWPSFYLVDKSGNIRGKFVGETHAGSKRDKAIRALIDKLMAEK